MMSPELTFDWLLYGWCLDQWYHCWLWADVTELPRQSSSLSSLLFIALEKILILCLLMSWKQSTDQVEESWSDKFSYNNTHCKKNKRVKLYRTLSYYFCAEMTLTDELSTPACVSQAYIQITPSTKCLSSGYCWGLSLTKVHRDHHYEPLVQSLDHLYSYLWALWLLFFDERETHWRNTWSGARKKSSILLSWGWGAYKGGFSRLEEELA